MANRRMRASDPVEHDPFVKFEDSPLKEMGAGMNAALHGGEAMIRSAIAAQQDWLSFLQKRMQADMQMWSALSGCRNSAYAARVQSGFWETMLADYFEEWRRLGSIWADAARNCSQPLAQSAVNAMLDLEQRAAGERAARD